MAKSFLKKDDESRALKYFGLAWNTGPKNDEYLKEILNLHVKNSHPDLVNTTNSYFSISPTSSMIYDEMFKIFDQYKKLDQLLVFYQSEIKEYSTNNIVLTYLYLNSALLVQTKSKPETLKYYGFAKRFMVEKMKDEKKLKEQIEKGLKECKLNKDEK